MTNKYLLDENVVWQLYEKMKALGQDVVLAGDVAKGASDTELLEYAFQTDHIVVTQDWDFGQLLFVDGKRSKGVVILVMSGFEGRLADRCQDVATLLTEHESELGGYLTVIDKDKVRRRPVPNRSSTA